MLVVSVVMSAFELQIPLTVWLRLLCFDPFRPLSFCSHLMKVWKVSSALVFSVTSRLLLPPGSVLCYPASGTWEQSLGPGSWRWIWAQWGLWDGQLICGLDFLIARVQVLNYDTWAVKCPALKQKNNSKAFAESWFLAPKWISLH